MSRWVCLDASWVVRFVLGATRQSPLPALWQTWHTTGCALAAPTLLYYEVGNALYRYVRQGDLSPEDAAQALDIALEMRLSRHGDADLHRRAIAVAREFALPAAYDAHYLALAERLRRAVDRRSPAAPLGALCGVASRARAEATAAPECGTI